MGKKMEREMEILHSRDAQVSAKDAVLTTPNPTLKTLSPEPFSQDPKACKPNCGVDPEWSKPVQHGYALLIPSSV